MAALAVCGPFGRRRLYLGRRRRDSRAARARRYGRLRAGPALDIALFARTIRLSIKGSESMAKPILAAALGAALLCYAAAAFAAPKPSEDEGPPKPLPPQQKNFPLDQTWSLRELNGKPVPEGLDASLKIDGNLRGSGFTGCNSWSATLYPVKDQHLAVGPFALTKKQCPKDVMAVEFGFLSSLIGNPSWDLVNGDLVIKGPRGAMRLARSL